MVPLTLMCCAVGNGDVLSGTSLSSVTAQLLPGSAATSGCLASSVPASALRGTSASTLRV